MLVKSGIAPLDARVGGLARGRSHVLCGAPGTGKSIACLEFLNAGLADGGTVALLTHDDPSDLLAQGEFLGLNLADAFASDRFVLVRYQLDFARRFARAAEPDIAFAELRSMLGSAVPDRIAIDSITPIIEAGTASGACVAALLGFLDGLGATSLLTYPGELAGRYDRRLDPLAQRAAAIFHLATERDGTAKLGIQKIRYAAPSTAPISFVIRSGVGIVATGDGLGRRAYDVPEETRRKLLVVSDQSASSAELLQVLGSRFDVALRAPAPRVVAQMMQSPTGAILLDVRRDSLDEALELVRELRRAGSKAAIALVTQFVLRASDRARALRAGADDFFVALHSEELLLRLEALVQRGRSGAIVMPEPTVSVAESRDGTGILDEEEFRTAVQSRLGANEPSFFTIVRLELAGDDRETLPDLARVARAQVRTESGDIVGIVGTAVLVYLHSARRKDIDPFVHRVRETWTATGGGPLTAGRAAYPAEEAELHTLLGALPA
jgi:KaiC/GvpD/RAD55 family RecA-like ATPase/DNA-binding response OmpR family regulator